MMDQTNVGNMNGFYNRQFSADDLESYASMNGQDTAMAMMGSHGMDAMGGMGAHANQTVAQLMSDQHQKDLNRRRSFHHSNSYNHNQSLQEHDSRRSSMLEFGSRGNIDMDTFQFDPTPQPPPTSAHNLNNNTQRQTGNIARRRLDSQRARRQNSNEELALNTSFSNMPTTYSPIPGSGSYQGLSASDPMGFDMSSNYMNMMGLDFGSMDSGSASGMTPRNSFMNNYASDLHASPIVQHNLSSQMGGQMHDPGGGMVTNNMNTQGMMGGQALNMPDQTPNMPTNVSQPPAPMQNPDMTVQMSDNSRSTTKPPPITNLDVRSDADGMPFQNPNNTGQQVIPQYRNAYSSSGFDMLGVLMRVAARPKPQINIGAVDMSCAFVVCDVTKHDLPIVYCSEVFERLTAYTKHEILGRNCRFLQAPDGRIKAGVKRKYVDDQSVLRIKKMIAQRQETQVSLINYRKGGQPFMNLLTMIPITWDTDEVKYYVGFQVDLVEQPSSVTNKNSDGSYAVSYQRGSTLPPYIMPDSHNRHGSELSQTVHRDDVSTVLGTIGSGESELSKRIWDKVLLENTDDVVHVLSLKGLFLYLSPSSRKVLEYDPAELVGTALSSVCHPSDIVPVTRELKDTATGAAVNVVFRVRRKLSGYTWFESHGSLHLEQGKGRKCIIMVGRERPVYALARNEVDAVGGIGESELWSKMSTSGMFLYVSANVRSLLDRQPEDLVGTSAQALMRQESRLEFGKKLEVARTGIKASFKHDIQNKRGQTLQAQTTIYPGDASEGQKPTFLVAQTRLLKLSRNTKRHNSNVSGKPDQIDDGGSGASSAASALSGQTPTSAPQTNYGEGITTQAGGSGLTIGNQHEALASEDNVFDELKTTRSTSWQFELRQMEKRNRLLAEELQSLLSSKKKRKRRNGAGNLQKDCANCHTRVTPEWRRGPSGNRDLCNSCGLRWAKENGRVTPRTSSQHSDKSASPRHPTSLTPMSALEQHAPNNNAPQQEKKQSPQTANTNSHINKVARMEATASEGFGGGIPPKIDEGIEYPAPKPPKM